MTIRGIVKVLYYVESLRSGGKERRLVELIKGISILPGMEILLVVMDRNIHYKEVFKANVSVHLVTRKYSKKDPLVSAFIYKIAKNFKPDLIHVWGDMVAVYALPAKLLLNIPMVNSQITTAPNKVPQDVYGYRLSFPFSDMIISNTYAGLISYSSPVSKSRVIYNGFDFSRIESIPSESVVRSVLNINSRFVVGMVASYDKKKDYETYIVAANKVLKSRCDVTFICIGSGDYQPYKRLVDKNNSGKFRFMGAQQEVEKFMSICDVGVLTTNVNNHGEGISNSLVEFSSMSIPIIATDNGGSRELIRNNVNGYLSEPFSSDDLAQKITGLLSSETMRQTMGQRAKETVQNKFGIKRMINEFCTAYDEIVDKL
jgi:glycosyltransferase involved in cell wall biosynthesis